MARVTRPQPRRAGSPWRILVHEWLGTKGAGIRYGRAHDVSNDPVSPCAGGGDRAAAERDPA